MSTDITGLATEKDGDSIGTTVVMKDRGGEPYVGEDGKPATMTILGEFAEPCQQAIKASRRRFLKQVRTNPNELDPDNEASIALGVAAVVAWSGWTLDGQSAPCTPENVRRALTAAPWLRLQVSAVVENPKVFSKSSSGV